MPSGAEAGFALCFHGGTRRDRGVPIASAGGRVLTFVGVGTTHADARTAAYAAVDACRLEGSQHRRDIGREVSEQTTAAPLSRPAAVPVPTAVSFAP